MLSYKEFAEEVRKNILNYLPDNYRDAQILLNEIVKTNDQRYTALSILLKTEDVAPNIYLENFYNSYQKTEDVNEEIKKIAEMQLKYQNENVLDFDVKDYDQIKNRLFIVALNKEHNFEYMSNGICQDIEGTDIATLVRVKCGNDEQGMGSFKVENKHLQLWNISKEDIYEQAKINTPYLFPMELQNMRDIMNQLFTDNEIVESNVSTEDILPYEQYVLSNRSHLNGATVMLYPDVLEQIAEKSQSNIFILPSSTHEVILMKDTGELSAEELQRMVIEVNRTQVIPEERLSDEVYCYDFKEHKLTMATDNEQTKQLVQQLCMENCFEEEFLYSSNRNQMGEEDYGEEQ